MFLMFQSSGIVSSPREWGCSSYPAGRYQIFFSSFNCHDYIWPSPYCLKHNIKILFNPGNMHKVFQGQTFEPRSDFLTWATPGSSPTCVHLSKAHIHTVMFFACCMYFTASAFFDLFSVQSSRDYCCHTNHSAYFKRRLVFYEVLNKICWNWWHI